jgi:ferric-dicitrate binding protein FerR (iron transport regulator)
MEDEIIGNYNSGEPEKINPDPAETENADLEAIRKIVDSIDLLKKMEAIDSRSALVKVKRKALIKRNFVWLDFLLRVAAILLLPLLFFSIWQGLQIAEFNQNTVQNSISTSPALRSVFTLPDGTKVWLNGNTTLNYPTFFKGSERLVELTGEAYFQVAANKQKPFVVKAGKLLVEAVGTEFNCMSYPGDSNMEIVLTEGKINILSEKANARLLLGSLTQNQLAVFNADNSSLKVSQVDTKKHTAWREGQIIFKNDRLSDVLNRLGRWYNVSFIFDSELKTDHAFTGSFSGEELTQILNYIELTTPIAFEVLKTEKDSAEIYSKTQIRIIDK